MNRQLLELLEHQQPLVEGLADPWYSQFPKLALCYGYISNGKIEGVLPILEKLIAFSDDNGAEFVGEPAKFFLALTDILKGEVTKGVQVMETLLAPWPINASGGIIPVFRKPRRWGPSPWRVKH